MILSPFVTILRGQCPSDPGPYRAGRIATDAEFGEVDGPRIMPSILPTLNMNPIIIVDDDGEVIATSNAQRLSVVRCDPKKQKSRGQGSNSQAPENRELAGPTSMEPVISPAPRHQDKDKSKAVATQEKNTPPLFSSLHGLVGSSRPFFRPLVQMIGLLSGSRALMISLRRHSRWSSRLCPQEVSRLRGATEDGQGGILDREVQNQDSAVGKGLCFTQGEQERIWAAEEEYKESAEAEKIKDDFYFTSFGRVNKHVMHRLLGTNPKVFKDPTGVSEFEGSVEDSGDGEEASSDPPIGADNLSPATDDGAAWTSLLFVYYLVFFFFLKSTFRVA
ncbi:hypothetical protein TIFTF001_035412 [Ficus carica]|uniref:Uncharacterized protein n=1 Tax=Ficus carica TaxID=3494 RepID=A0AA88J9N9_FICCA|nr:hypothetical protein TIFTF001_035412 [Ficus carica]